MSVTALASGAVKGLTGDEAAELAGSQNDRLLLLLRSLNAEEWDAPTDCDQWTVKDIAAHILGWAEAFTSVPELWRQTKEARRVRRDFPTPTDAQNHVQVQMRRSLSPPDLVKRLEKTLPGFLRVRKRWGVVGRYIPFYTPLLGWGNGGYLFRTIFTRDTFMHRIDIARATGRDLVLDEREARIVADVVREWARRSRADGRLRLSGPAGGDYVLGSGSRATLEADAVEFARVMAGRADASGIHVVGDKQAAGKWLQTASPF